MTPAQEILRMIEGVAVDDTDSLNEINAHVHIYVGKDASLMARYEWNIEKCLSLYRQYPQLVSDYCGSRDALKAIRPDGWWPASYERDRVCVGSCPTRIGYENQKNPGFENRIHSPRFLPTEELAELHAIIQAIQHDRDNAATNNQKGD